MFALLAGGCGSDDVPGEGQHSSVRLAVYGDMEELTEQQRQLMAKAGIKLELSGENKDDPCPNVLFTKSTLDEYQAKKAKAGVSEARTGVMSDLGDLFEKGLKFVVMEPSNELVAQFEELVSEESARITQPEGTRFFFYGIGIYHGDMGSYARLDVTGAKQTIRPINEEGNVENEYEAEMDDYDPLLDYEDLRDWLLTTGIDQTGKAAARQAVSAATNTANLAELASIYLYTYSFEPWGKKMIVNNWIYSFHEFSKNEDWYAMWQECLFDGSKDYRKPSKPAGHYKSIIDGNKYPVNSGSVVENYMHSYRVENEPIVGGKPITLTAPSPVAFNNVTKHTTSSTFSWGVGTKVGFKAGSDGKVTGSVSGSLSLGGSYSKSQAFDVYDVTVEANLRSDAVIWRHIFEPPKDGSKDAPALARSLYTPSHMWVWKVSSSELPDFGYVCRTYATRAGTYNTYSGTQTKRTTAEMGQNAIVHPPRPPYFAVEKADLTFERKGEQSQKVGVGCQGEWSFVKSPGADWLSVFKTSEGLNVEAGLNDSGASRSATVTINGGVYGNKELTVNQH
jgi:hypothetical protein